MLTPSPIRSRVALTVGWLVSGSQTGTTHGKHGEQGQPSVRRHADLH
jgi:hypothetical protein